MTDNAKVKKACLTETMPTPAPPTGRYEEEEPGYDVLGSRTGKKPGELEQLGLAHLQDEAVYSELVSVAN